MVVIQLVKVVCAATRVDLVCAKPAHKSPASIASAMPQREPVQQVNHRITTIPKVSRINARVVISVTVAALAVMRATAKALLVS